MKVNLYIDIYEGNSTEYLTASSTPIEKQDGARRYKICVNVPDIAFTGKVDGVLPVDEFKEVDLEV